MTERLRTRLVLPIVAGLLFALPVAAQAPASTREDAALGRTMAAPSLMVPATGEAPAAHPADDRRANTAVEAPTMDGLRAGVRASVAREEGRTPNAIVAQRSGLSQPEVLMIVGGAALLAGAIIGDDAGTIIMIGGAGIGLWGLYLYLQ